MRQLVAIIGFLALLIASDVAGERVSLSDFSAAEADVDWSRLNASALAAIPSTEFTTISKEALSSIPDAACEGFQADQIQALPDEVCITGFRPAQLARIPSLSFRGLKLECFKSFLLGSTIPITADQILHVSPAVFNNLGQLIQYVPLAVFAQMSPQNASAMSGLTCQNLMSAELGAMQPETFGALLDECVDVLPPSAWDGFSPQQAPYFRRLWVQSWDELALAYVKAESFGSLTDEVYGAFPATLCSAVSGHQMSKVAPASMAAFTVTCLGACQSCFTQIAAEQISAIRVVSFPSVSYFFETFPPEAYAGITGPQFSATSNGKDWSTCSRITPAGIRYLKEEALAEFSQGCWSALSQATLANITKDMIRAFPDDMFKAVISFQIGPLPDDAFAELSPTKFSYMLRRSGAWESPCSVIRPAQLSFLPADCFPEINGACARFFTPSHIALLSQEQLSRMSSLACDYFTEAFIAVMRSNLAGLTGACVGRLKPTSLSTLTNSAALFLKPDAWGAMNSSHIQNIPLPVWELLPPESLARIRPEALTGIVPEGILRVNPKAFASLTVDQFWQLQQNVFLFPRITAAQWSNMSVPLFANISCLRTVVLNAPAWASISKEQFQNLRVEIFEDSGSCLGLSFWLQLINVNNVWQWMTPQQFGAADAVFCGAILPPAVNIPLETWANMSLACAWALNPYTIDALVTYDILKAFQPEVQEYFTTYVCLPSAVVTKMSIPELQALKPLVLGCMKAGTWVDLINAHKDNVTNFIYDTWQPSSFAGDASDSREWEQLKYSIASPTDRKRFLAYPPMKYRVNNPQYARLNVIGLSFMLDTVDEVEITSLASLRGPTIAGLQPSLLKRVTPQAIDSILPEQGPWITVDILINLDPERHIPYIPPEVIKTIRFRVLVNILDAQLRRITNAQFRQFGPLTMSGLTCQKLKALSDQQLQGISSNQALALDLRARETGCIFETSFSSRSAWTPPVPPPSALVLPQAPAWVYAAFGLAGITLVVVIITAIVVYVYIRHAGNPNNQIIQPSARSLFGSRRSSQDEEPELPQRPLLADPDVAEDPIILERSSLTTDDEE
eukprot:TRINITY_DN5037_c0_g1_i1.p1 TRINITY_DN5037_c0_g1~~TRINITY_DN5037_c0_g1_i1.p1  ORF type:complete len:1078 (+),score=116.02 TRINITY_DN5037_c0_g1_i1:148-3381(+)